MARIAVERIAAAHVQCAEPAAARAATPATPAEPPKRMYDASQPARASPSPSLPPRPPLRSSSPPPHRSRFLYCRSGNFSVETGKLILRTVTQNERTRFLKYIIRLVHLFSECASCRPGMLTSARLDFEYGICTPLKRLGVLGRAPRSVGLLIAQRSGAGKSSPVHRRLTVAHEDKQSCPHGEPLLPLRPSPESPVAAAHAPLRRARCSTCRHTRDACRAAELESVLSGCRTPLCVSPPSSLPPRPPPRPSSVAGSGLR